jgi:hypothetical protein
MVCSSSSNVYEFLLACCPPYSFTPSWSFLQASKDCRGPVWDPAQTLAALRSEFPEVTLKHAGVLDRGPDGKYRLTPELTNPLGAVIALRTHRKQAPFCLLTARGCLPKKRSPIRATLKDSWTRRRLARGGILFAPPRIGDVVILRALGFPATLATGIGRLTPDQLRDLDLWFDGQDLERALQEPAEPTDEEAEQPGDEETEQPTEDSPGQESRKAPPLTLALLGWSPLSLAAQPAQVLAPAVAHLTAARHYLGLRFTGVMAWQLAPGDLANLQFRLNYRDPRLIEQFLKERVDSLVDFEGLAHGPGPGAGTPGSSGSSYVEAQAALLAALADDRVSGGQSHRVRRAMSIYEEIVQRDLIAPLQTWALDNSDPVFQSAGIELATVCGLLHRMSPLLADSQSARFERARNEDIELLPPKTLTQYLALIDRFSILMRNLYQWMRP